MQTSTHRHLKLDLGCNDYGHEGIAALAVTFDVV